MDDKKRLPVGIEDFVEIRKGNFYYVDKTKMIEQLLTNWGSANLFTRPRRFGKSLNMSMLKAFFSIDTDKKLFDDLYISENKKLCEEYMGKYPVLSISLKRIEARNYDIARNMAASVISDEAKRFQFLLESNNLSEIDKNDYKKLIQDEMSEQTLRMGLKDLSRLLHKHYNQKVIVLIDEYDVPLAKANEYGYYDQMIDLIRSIFGNLLKTNEAVLFSVLTGCLQIAKESIFTGLNTFSVYSIADVEFDEYFGFTDEEVKKILEYYNQNQNYSIIKEWYDGYRFGSVDVYCPWDVLNYVKTYNVNPSVEPKNYWSNTSGNDVITHFIDSLGKENQLTKYELEKLVNGETVYKNISHEITYKDLYSNINNIWSTLFMTGYLTQRGKADGSLYPLAIPNLEIRNIITEHILTKFSEKISKDGKMQDEFTHALLNGDENKVQTVFSKYMAQTISVRETYVRSIYKENFYHGLLLGILSYKAEWLISSNKESGDGFSDIMIEAYEQNTGIIIEVKYAEDNLEDIARKAIKQINSKNYSDNLVRNGMKKIMKYGIVCCKKQCVVKVEMDLVD